LSTTGYDVNNKYLYKLSGNLKLTDFIDTKSRVKYTMAPSEFLSVIRDAKLIVTASFHCVAISIIMNKPFVAVLTGNKGKDERLLNILSLLGLEERIFTNQMNEEQVNKPINYVSVNKKIEELKASSMNFLLSAIQY
jgi:polysaccharide pyruvyl transferase WcaK-like protein